MSVNLHSHLLQSIVLDCARPNSVATEARSAQQVQTDPNTAGGMGRSWTRDGTRREAPAPMGTNGWTNWTNWPNANWLGIQGQALHSASTHQAKQTQNYCFITSRNIVCESFQLDIKLISILYSDLYSILESMVHCKISSASCSASIRQTRLQPRWRRADGVLLHQVHAAMFVLNQTI